MGIWRLLLILSTPLLILSCATAGSEKTDEELADIHVRLGTSFLKSGKYPAAYREFSKAVKLDPGNHIVHNQLALTLYAREKYKDAENHLKEALSLKSDYSDARNNLGRLYLVTNRYSLAVDELQKVVDDLKYPHPQIAHVNLGEAHLKAGDQTKAQVVLARAIRMNRDSCPAHNLYGQSLYRQRRFDLAAKALDKATQICKNLDETRYFSALSHFRLGQAAKAVARLEELIKENPQSKYLAKSKQLLRKANKQ